MAQTKSARHNADSAGLTESPVATFAAGRSVRRWVYVVLGMLSVGLAAVGVFVPGLPTTVFLILGSYFFTRSCPWLEDRLIRNRLFGPYLRYLDGDAEMPTRARVLTILVMWLAVTGSSVLMASKGALAPWFLITVAASALVGSVVVWRFRRTGSSAGKQRSLSNPPSVCPAHHVSSAHRPTGSTPSHSAPSDSE